MSIFLIQKKKNNLIFLSNHSEKNIFQTISTKKIKHVNAQQNQNPNSKLQNLTTTNTERPRKKRNTREEEPDPKVPLRFYYFIAQTINSTIFAVIPFILMIIMIKYNHKRVGIKSSQISYFNLSLLIFMLANAISTVLLNTSGEIGQFTFTSAVYFILDIVRLLLNGYVMYLTCHMTDNEIVLIDGYNSLNNTNESFRDSFLSITQMGEEELSKHDYFICKINKKQTIGDQGEYAHEFTVVFKPFVYHLRQSAFLSDSLNSSRRKSSVQILDKKQSESTMSRNTPKNSFDQGHAGEIHQVSLNMSFDVIHPRPRISSFANYMKEIVNKLEKTPKQIGEFVTQLLQLRHCETENFKFFQDTIGTEVDLEELELFLNKFMNQTYKTSVQISKGCHTLNQIKTFLNLEYDLEVPNLVAEFSLRMEFPFYFCPTTELFQKLFPRFLVTGLHSATNTLQIKIMNTSNQQIYRLERSLKSITALMQKIHSNIPQLNFSNLHSEKKRKEIVYLLHVLLNEITNTEDLSQFLGAKIEPILLLDLKIPEILTQFESLGDLSDPENVVYIISVQCRDINHQKSIKRNRYHFEVLSNHLFSKFCDLRYRINMSRIFDSGYVKEYLDGLIRDPNVWRSIEFQLFMDMAALDFEAI